jgi:NitT/TauT family transport system substrate-binding protein
MHARRSLLTTLLLTLALGAAACAGAGSPAGGSTGGNTGGGAGTTTGTTSQSQQPIKLKVGWCSQIVTSAGAPFYIGKEMGWWQEENLELEVLPIAGSTACVQQTATGAVDVSLPSVEPIAIGRQPSKGIKTKIFYTAYQGNIYGIAVPEDSPIRELRDLKGKRIGVTSMTSGGAPVAKALAASVGLDPDADISLVVAGEGPETAAVLKQGQVDALSQFDTQYALVENAGIKLRLIRAPEFDGFPSNGFTVTDQWLSRNEQAAIALGRGYAKGTIFAIANPEAAVKIFWKYNPDARPTGKSDEEALREGVNVLNARIANWKLEKAGVSKWGENNVRNYASYIKYLTDQGLIAEPVQAEDVVTNQWIDQINNFDPKKIEEAAREWRG